jgi:hypothetical protein
MKSNNLTILRVITVACVLLLACGSSRSGSEQNPPNPLIEEYGKGESFAEVYKYDESVQCEDEGISLDEMALELTDAGVTVLAPRKGHDCCIYTANCGNATGRINVYIVPANDLNTARDLGFKPFPPPCCQD